MFRVLKGLTIAMFLVVVYAIISHGIIVPRVLWEKHLNAFQAQHPDRNIEVERVVLGLSANPRLLLSGVSVRNPQNGESIEIGLVRMGLNLSDSLDSDLLVVESLGIKGMRINKPTQLPCTTEFATCMPKLPLELLRSGSVFQFNIDALDIEKAQLVVRNSTTVELSSVIDELSYSKQAQSMSLGWRLNHSSGLESYVAMKAKPTQRTVDGKTGIELLDLNVEFKGKWAGFPWTGTFAQSRLLLHGTPIVNVAGENMRMYVRRDDAPDTHQAAFSAKTIQGGLPMQAWKFEAAEWTFTHKDALAWTFDLDWNPAEQLAHITPATIAGSEGIPATAHVRKPDCNNLPVAMAMRPSLSPVWAWSQGWFRLLDLPPTQDAAVVLCLQATL